MRRALLTVALAAGLVAGASAARAGQPEAQRPETQLPEAARHSEPAATHRGSIDRLLGPDPAPGLLARYSPDRQVDDATPPTLLLLSDDDRGVPPANSLRYYEALKARGIPASMHIYPSGGHGWGIKKSFAYKAEWQQALLEWLENLK